MTELKPCPFCGAMPQTGVDFYETYGYGKGIKLAAIVECTGCGIRKREIFTATDSMHYIPFSDYEDAFDKVVEQWNRRMPIPDEWW